MMLNTAIFSWFLINVVVMASHSHLRRSEHSFALSDTGKVSRLMLFILFIYLFFLKTWCVSFCIDLFGD